MQNDFRMIFHGGMFQFSVENNPGLQWFVFASLSDWFWRAATSSRPIGRKTNDMATRVLIPALWEFFCFYFEFSLAFKNSF